MRPPSLSVARELNRTVVPVLEGGLSRIESQRPPYFTDGKIPARLSQIKLHTLLICAGQLAVEMGPVRRAGKDPERPRRSNFSGYFFLKLQVAHRYTRYTSSALITHTRGKGARERAREKIDAQETHDDDADGFRREAYRCAQRERGQRSGACGSHT